MSSTLTITALQSVPLVQAGDDLAAIALAAYAATGLAPADGDVLVLAQKIVSSDPDEQVERIRPYVELGFRHLVFHAPGPDQPRFLKLYAEQVLPRLRKAFG